MVISTMISIEYLVCAMASVNCSSSLAGLLVCVMTNRNCGLPYTHERAGCPGQVSGRAALTAEAPYDRGITVARFGQNSF